MFADFAGVCFDQIANQLAKYRYMTGGQVSVPVTIRLANGAGAGFGVPALADGRELVPQRARAEDRGARARRPTPTACCARPSRDDDPVLYFEHKGMLNLKGELARRPGARSSSGRAAVVRDGRDVTVVATQLMRDRADEARGGARRGGHRGRADRPAHARPARHGDDRRQRRAHQPPRRRPGVAGRRELGRDADRAVVPSSFDSLDAPPVLVCGDDTPVPYAGPLEQAWIPSAERIADAVRQLGMTRVQFPGPDRGASCPAAAGRRARAAAARPSWSAGGSSVAGRGDRGDLADSRVACATSASGRPRTRPSLTS